MEEEEEGGTVASRRLRKSLQQVRAVYEGVARSRAGCVLEIKPRELAITKGEGERGRTGAAIDIGVGAQGGSPEPSFSPLPAGATTTPSIARSGRGKGKKKKSLGQAFPECASCWRWAGGGRGATARVGRAGGRAGGGRRGRTQGSHSARPGPQHG